MLPEYDQTDFVFVASIQEVIEKTIFPQQPEDTLKVEVKYRIQLEETFKGRFSELNYLAPPIDGCKPKLLQKGQQYIFYIRSKIENPSALPLSHCTKIKPVLRNTKDYKWLNDKEVKPEIFSNAIAKRDVKYSKAHLKILRLLNLPKAKSLKIKFVGATTTKETNKVVYTKGQINFTGFLFNGKRTGPWKMFYPPPKYTSYPIQRKLWQEGNYKSGKKEGVWKMYDYDWNTLKAILKSDLYREGKIIKGAYIP